MKNKKIIYDLKSKDNNVIEVINKLKLDTKRYKKIISLLQSSGNFNPKIEVHIFNIENTEDSQKIKLFCEDLDCNLYIFYAFSSDKKDLNYMEKVTNVEDINYDMSLSKKFEITKENVNLLETKDIYHFKFGRLITNNNTFYSIFLGDDIEYQLRINVTDDNKLKYQCILDKLNKLDNKPTFITFIKIIEDIIKENNIIFDTISIYSYKEFKESAKIKFDEKENVKKLQKENK